MSCLEWRFLEYFFPVDGDSKHQNYRPPQLIYPISSFKFPIFQFLRIILSIELFLWDWKLISVGFLLRVLMGFLIRNTSVKFFCDLQSFEHEFNLHLMSKAVVGIKGWWQFVIVFDEVDNFRLLCSPYQTLVLHWNILYRLRVLYSNICELTQQVMDQLDSHRWRCVHMTSTLCYWGDPFVHR